MPKRYAVLDLQNVVVNMVMWDGVSLYNPGEGLRLVLIDNNPSVWIGSTQQPDGSFAPSEDNG